MAKERFISTTKNYEWVNEPPKGKDGAAAIIWPDGERKELPISEAQMLRFCFSGWKPNMDIGHVLVDPADIVAFTEAKKALAGEGEHGYIRLDSSQHAVVVKVVRMAVPLQGWFEELTPVLKILSDAPDSSPWIKAVKDDPKE